MGRATRDRVIQPVGWCLSSFGLLALALNSGCAGIGQRWRKKPEPPLQASMSPPSVEGSAVRSQDASKLTRRVGGKKGYGGTTTPGDPPNVAWSGPPSSQPSQVVPLPAAPELPVDLPAPLPTSTADAPASPVARTEVAQVHTPPPSRPAPTAAAGAPATSPAVQEPSVVQEPGAAEAATDLARIRVLINDSKIRLSQATTYQTRLRRQERVGTTLQPAEEVLLSIRREPIAVRLEWPTGPNKGREVLYSKVETEGKLQINQPGSLMPRMTLNPDSPLVLRNSRHPISEAGFDILLRNLENSLQPHEVGTPTLAKLSCEGPVDVPELGRPCHKITEVRANGETWIVCLDAESLMPVMVRGSARDGALLELYQFRDIALNVPELSTAAAFAPDARWGKAGVLSRLARSADAPETPTGTAR